MQTTNIPKEKTFDFSQKQRQDLHPQATSQHAVRTPQMPLKSFRTGALCVSIWENEGVTQAGEPTTYKTVSFERRYKDPKSGEWKTNNSLRLNDLPKATLILQKAYEYLILTESEHEEAY